MLQEEFEKMVGFEIEYNLYKNWIEPKYYEFYKDKREFVEHLKSNGTIAGLKLIYSEEITRKAEREKANRKLDKIWRKIEIARWEIEKLNKRLRKAENWELYKKRDEFWTEEYKLNKEKLQILHGLYPNEPRYFEGRN